MKLDLFALGSRVALLVENSMRTSSELDTVACELTTVGDRVHRGGVLVQEVDLLQGQSLGLKQDVSFFVVTGGEEKMQD